MDADYAKAKQRASKKGRTLPPQDEYYASYGIYYGMSFYRPTSAIAFIETMPTNTPRQLTCRTPTRTRTFAPRASTPTATRTRARRLAAEALPTVPSSTPGRASMADAPALPAEEGPAARRPGLVRQTAAWAPGAEGEAAMEAAAAGDAAVVMAAGVVDAVDAVVRCQILQSVTAYMSLACNDIMIILMSH